MGRPPPLQASEARACPSSKLCPTSRPAITDLQRGEVGQVQGVMVAPDDHHQLPAAAGRAHLHAATLQGGGEGARELGPLARPASGSRRRGAAPPPTLNWQGPMTLCACSGSYLGGRQRHVRKRHAGAQLDGRDFGSRGLAEHISAPLTNGRHPDLARTLTEL